MSAFKLPPYARTMGMDVDHIEDGGVPVIAMDFADKVQGRPGFLHGGAIGGLLEMAAHAALRAELDPFEDLTHSVAAKKQLAATLMRRAVARLIQEP